MAPYGSWRSPITAELVATGGTWLRHVMLDGDDVYWLELRPAEGGRTTVVRLDRTGASSDVSPPGANVRTLVHEYGGGAAAVADGTLYFSEFVDQRLYRQDPGAAPRPISPEVPDRALRYADLAVDRGRGLLFCVREDHRAAGHEAVNTIAVLDLDGVGEGRVVLAGHDFYSSPRLSPDGTRLAWLGWDHPNMPWDGCELWAGEIATDGSIVGARLVAGGPEESIYQPEWSPDGVLHFVSDRTGWWNLYRWRDGPAEPLYPAEAEFGRPQWLFGSSTYAFLGDKRIACADQVDGRDRLSLLDPGAGRLEPLDERWSEILYLRAAGGRLVFVGGSPTEPSALVRLDPESGRCELLRRERELDLDPDYLSAPRAVEFPTEGGLTAHGLLYLPRNADVAAPPLERPPLLVKSHGGPTSAASGALELEIQFWTSRGWAVLDVDYGGSTGHGRAYRRRLEGNWGVVDVDDCVNGARHLVAQGLVDPERLAIDGGSAGGYTTLCALTFRDTFRAGASYYGIGDLEAFVHDTHKFESHYLERLVGPYPERIDLYRERSPIRFVDRLSCPVILFQGLEDAIVPPNQAEMMVEALRAKRLPVAYLPFEGEQHGFRRAETIRRALEAEYYFFARVFGFEPADPIEPVPIENI